MRKTEYINNINYGVPQTNGGENVYSALIEAMKTEGVTSVQLAKLLDCRQATISDKLNGIVKNGFYFDEAIRIHEVFFEKYDFKRLFTRDKMQTFVR